ncbi:hypothetical protein [Hymenobacter koreensis]|uniref:hypothetical protein n=1 Tax=Hymenobacter koreensis TaxID=1084523 RepID=UPI0031EB40B3
MPPMLVPSVVMVPPAVELPAVEPLLMSLMLVSLLTPPSSVASIELLVGSVPLVVPPAFSWVAYSL